MLYPINLNHAFSRSILLGNEVRRTVSISFSKVMEATPQRALPQWLLECSANCHKTKEPNPPPTKRSKMSREDQLLGRVMGKRPLKDISNNADPKQRRKEKDSERKRSARAKESYKEKAKRLNYQKDYVKDKRCRETDEQHQARLKDLSTRAQEQYASKTDEQHQVCLMDARMRDQERRANESEEQREIRQSRLCQRDHETRGTETDEQRAQRNQRMREYMQQLAANQPPPAPSPERARQLELLRKDLKTFHNIRQSPTSTCCTCDRLCYPKGTSLIDVGKVHNTLQQHYRFAMNDPQVSSLLPIEDSAGSVCVCSRYMAFIKKGKLPPFSSINNMKVDAVPPELTRLNTMEQRLIARVQAFMKLIVLPLGQRALAGQTINFPVNVSEVCNSLPRLLNSDGIICDPILENQPYRGEPRK